MGDSPDMGEPMHRTLPRLDMLHPLTGAPVVALGWRKDGRPIFPILGGDPTNDPPTDPPADPPAPHTPPADKGFPEGTPVAEMSVEQQAAYWKFQSRRHEDRVKAYGDISPEKARESLSLAEQLRQAALSDQERAVEEAKAEARAAAIAENAPRLVAAEFRAAAAGKLTDAQTQALVEDLDLTKYLTDKGEVDIEKVTKKVDAFAPAAPKTPPLGQGHRSGTPGSGVSTGADLYASRHGNRTTPART